ncbi:MAG TPA: hypothetical protein VFH66_09860 [Mycobacteriales bacterium]|nr:hypothetical protein [Mycobacteriales bacterium]
MRKSIALAVTALTTAGLAAFVPTSAFAACTVSCSGDTTVTATVGTTGVISIAVSPTAALAGTSTAATGLLGPTTVTDTQTGTHTWQVAIKSTDFTLLNATSPTVGAGIIPAGNASVSFSGTGAVAPAPTVAGTATISGYPTTTPLALTTSNQTLMSASAGNANTVTYTPYMSLSFSSSDPVGVYTGTVTQTVS